MTLESIFYCLVIIFIIQFATTGVGFFFLHLFIFKLHKKLDSFIGSNKFNNEKMDLDVKYVSTSTNQTYSTNISNICEKDSNFNKFESFSQMLENQTCQELEIIPEITKVIIANEPEITTVISTYNGSAISTCLFIISIIICRSL